MWRQYNEMTILMHRALVILFLTLQEIKLSQPWGESADANPLHVRLHIDNLMNTDGYPTYSPSPSTV